MRVKYRVWFTNEKGFSTYYSFYDQKYFQEAIDRQQFLEYQMGTVSWIETIYFD